LSARHDQPVQVRAPIDPGVRGPATVLSDFEFAKHDQLCYQPSHRAHGQPGHVSDGLLTGPRVAAFLVGGVRDGEQDKPGVTGGLRVIPYPGGCLDAHADTEPAQGWL
jgi:hypothetical protein